MGQQTNEESGKYQLILDYNKTKGSVATCDKMCAAYSVSNITRIWLLVTFYAMTNISGIYSHILFVTIMLMMGQTKELLLGKHFQNPL